MTLHAVIVKAFRRLADELDNRLAPAKPPRADVDYTMPPRTYVDFDPPAPIAELPDYTTGIYEPDDEYSGGVYL